MQILEVSIAGVRAAVITLRSPDSDLRLELFPMMHLGRAEFYRQVSERLAGCDLIVAEGRDQGSSTGLAYLLAARATRQRGVRRLVHQNIDYAALGVPVLWPDFPTGNTRPNPRNRWRIAGALSWLDVLVIGTYQLVRMGLGGRGQLARSFREITDDSRPRLPVLGDLLLHQRDRALIRIVSQLHAEHTEHSGDTGQRGRAGQPDRAGQSGAVVAVAYGAAHMPAVIRALGRLGYRAVSADWLTVVDFTESPVERAEWHPRS